MELYPTLNPQAKIAIIGAFLIAIIAFGSPLSGLLTGAQEAKSEIRIALLQPRTAPVLNFYGTWAIQGFHLGLEYATGDKKPENLEKLLNMEDAVYRLPDGRSIIVRVFDTQGNPDFAASKAREAIEEWGADILAGVTFSSVAVTVAAVAKEYEIPFFVFPAAAATITQEPVFSKYVFRVARNVEQDSLAMAYYSVEVQGYKKFAILAADYEFGWSYVEAIQAALSRYPGTRIVQISWAPLTTTDFRPYLERIREAQPDVLILVWAGDFSPIFRDLAALGMLEEIPLASFMVDLFTTNFLNFCIPGLEGILEGLQAITYDAYRANPSPMYETLSSMMVEEDIRPYDFLEGHPCEALDKLSKARVPDLWHPPAFATAQFIVDAVKAVPDLDKDRFIAYLEGRTMETPMGLTTIRAEDHQALRPFFIVNITIDTDPESETYGLAVGKHVDTIPLEVVTPRILTSYKPYPKEFSVTLSVPSTVGTVPFTTRLTASIEGGTPPYECTWSLGDGTSREGLTVEHTYSEPGIYKVEVRCSDKIGLEASDSAEIAVVRKESLKDVETTPTKTPEKPPEEKTTRIETVTTPGAEGLSALTIALAVAVIVLLATTIYLALRRGG